MDKARARILLALDPENFYCSMTETAANESPVGCPCDGCSARQTLLGYFFSGDDSPIVLEQL